MPPELAVTPELAQFLADVSQETGRQTGIIIDRRGRIQYVIVGDSNGIVIPQLGRIRSGAGRFRGIRLIHTHLRGEPLSTDDLNDLSLLSLDLVAVVDARTGRNPLELTLAHLLPVNPEGEQWKIIGPSSVHKLEMDFARFIHALESEFSDRLESAKAARKGERTVLVALDDGRHPDPEWEIEELRELAVSAGLQIVDLFRQRRAPDNRYFIGKGKLLDIMVKTMQLEVDLMVFSPDLTPAQVKNISDMADIRVIDRTQLILDIFAQRARSADGKLQVELAQLRYLAPRLLGAGRAMSRLLGGIGVRGPGETKLETDRRKIKQRIQQLERRLKLLGSQRKERRRLRSKNQVPAVSIVGYTNAGKSTLLNTLTGSAVPAEDRLFATLDPFSKRLRFPRDREIVLTDTVGFIKDLPGDLKAAFRATLEELDFADLLIHVVDVSNPRSQEQLEAVESLLFELGLHLTPRITVFNKIDRLDDRVTADNWARLTDGVPISAIDKSTLRPLVRRIEESLWNDVDSTFSRVARGERDEEELHS